MRLFEYRNLLDNFMTHKTDKNNRLYEILIGIVQFFFILRTFYECSMCML